MSARIPAPREAPKVRTRWLEHTPAATARAFERRCKAASAREAEGELRRPPFLLGALDEAQALARRAVDYHAQADAATDPERRAALRRTACQLELDADRVVPVEYRP